MVRLENEQVVIRLDFDFGNTLGFFFLVFWVTSHAEVVPLLWVENDFILVCVCVCVFWLENNTYNKKKKVWYKESLRGTAKELPILPWLCVGLCFIKASPMVHQVKNPLAKQETQETRVRSLGQEDSLEEKNGNPFQYSCLKNFMDRFAWRAIIHGVAKVGHDWAPVRLCYHRSRSSCR